MTQSVYAQSGVNISAGDDFSKMAFKLSEDTWENSPYVRPVDLGSSHFRGPRGFRFANLPPDCVFDIAADGIGTKRVISVEGLTIEQSARDVVAMTFYDILRYGGNPLIFCNVFDVASLVDENKKLRNEMIMAIAGLSLAAHEQRFVMGRGETAELGSLVGSENPDQAVRYNWAGFALGIYDPRHILRGDTIEPGDMILAVREPGFRSNGFSAVRKALRSRFGTMWWNHPEAAASIAAAAVPSTLHVPFWRSVLGWNGDGCAPACLIKSFTHVTGGGIVGKFGEDILFPQDLSAIIDTPYDPPKVMYDCMLWNTMKQREAYRTFNGGHGVLIVTTKPWAEDLLARAERAGVEMKPVGRVVREAQPRLAIHSAFGGEVLEYFPGQKD